MAFSENIGGGVGERSFSSEAVVETTVEFRDNGVPIEE